jgi:pyruvate-formate lyase-activating enzyme
LYAVVAGLTVTVAEPERVLSWVEVAVIVTEVALETGGAVNRPDELTLPALADHVTAELKLPVPDTFAEQLLVWSEVTIAGEQVTLIEVMVGAVVLSSSPPSPQAVARNTPPTTSQSPSARMRFPL